MKWDHILTRGRKSLKVLCLSNINDVGEALESGELKDGVLIKWVSILKRDAMTHSTPGSPTPTFSTPFNNTLSTPELEVPKPTPPSTQNLKQNAVTSVVPMIPTPLPQQTDAVQVRIRNPVSFWKKMFKPKTEERMFKPKTEERMFKPKTEERFKRLKLQGMVCYVCGMPRSEWGDQIEGKTVCGECKRRIEDSKVL